MENPNGSKPKTDFRDYSNRRKTEGSPTMKRQGKFNLRLNNTRYLFRLGTLGLLVLTQTQIIHSHAATIVKAHTFSPGTSISSSQVNANFDQIVTELNAKEARIGLIESRITSTLTSSVTSPNPGGRTVRDSGGNVLGTLVNFDGATLTLLSSNQFFYKVKANGGLASDFSSVYYSDSGCTTPVGISVSDNYLAANFLIIGISGNIFRPSAQNSNGTAQASNVSGSWYYFMAGSCSPTSGSAWLAPVTPMTRTEAGIPLTITPPFQYQ